MSTNVNILKLRNGECIIADSVYTGLPIHTLYEDINRLLNNTSWHCVVAFIGDASCGEIAGYRFYSFPNSDFYSQAFGQKLYVVPEHRRKGIATALLNASHSLAKKQGASLFFTSVDSNNIVSLAAMKKAGYKTHSNRAERNILNLMCTLKT